MPEAAAEKVAKDRRQQLEQGWHDQHFRAAHAERIPASVRDRYLAPLRGPLFPLEQLFHWCGNPRGQRILVVGCGTSNVPTLLALAGAQVTALDISQTAILFQDDMASENGVRLLTRCGPAEEMDEQDPFDVVLGSMVLHHFPDALEAFHGRLLSLLKPGGLAIFSEPIAFSPLLSRLRRLFPASELSPGERQLTRGDVKLLVGRALKSEACYFNLFARLNRFVSRGTTLESASGLSRSLCISLARLDRLLLRLAPLQRYAGVVVLKLTRSDIGF